MEFLQLVKDEQQPGIGLHIPSQPKIAENIIHFLVERRLFPQALTVYQNIITSGFIPLPSTDALFLAVIMKTSQAPGHVQLNDFKKIMAYPSFTESHLLEFLDHVEKLEIDPDSCSQLVRLFIDVKGENSTPSRSLLMKLIDLDTKAGNLENASQLIDDSSSSFDIPAEPYARVIRSTNPGDDEAVDWIMDVMREKDVPVHILVFNSLISRQRRSLGGIQRAFAFYNIIMRLAATTPLKPDVFTYKQLFRMLGYHYKQDYRPNTSRNLQRVSVLTRPRQLFYDMMMLWFNSKLHAPASHSLEIRATQIQNDEAVLTVALRAFLYLDDYSAAIITLETFPKIGIPITERLYFVILRYLARKVYYDVLVSRKKKTYPVVAHFMLGSFNSSKIIKRDPTATYEWIMQRLLEKHCDTNGRQGRVPTVAEILAQDVARSGEPCDAWPLVNMLRRWLQMNASTTREPWGGFWRKRNLSAVRFEMVPQQVQLWQW
ncbi:F-box domain-containing protein [Mycena indigotica]|uniref:F-box domain-containing protein n=1 Tax=Mycena indigotica TaxID=2126181 RepID=A0A8H6TEN5_9AGAR|nr:F-box domain-containing protein [Mycena indigotica]KAF7315312.1 F-box domain-containing protein [Mycena indigotica]